MRRASKLPTTVEQHLTGSAGLSDCRQHQLAASGRDAAGLEIGPRIGTTRGDGTCSLRFNEAGARAPDIAHHNI